MYVSQWFSGRILGKIMTVAIVSLGLHGCGGGGSTATSPPPPPPPPPPPANVAPTANAGADQAVSSFDVVTLDGSASSDSDGTVDTYAWSQTGGSAVTLDETDPIMPTFDAPNVGGDEVLTFELIVTDDDGAMSTADTVLVTINPTLALPFTDDFSDGNSDGWTIFDDAISIASSWDASSGRLVQSDRTNTRGGDVTESYRRGTYAVLDDSVNLTNYRLSVETSVRSGSSDDIGVMFRYVDDDNYYRFSRNSNAGGSRLESKVNGMFTTLASNFRGYQPNSSANITIEVEGPLIQVFVEGTPLFSAYDTDLATGGIAMYGRDGVRFDDVTITPNSSDPEIVIASPVADLVIPRGPRNVTVDMIVRNMPAAGSVDVQFGGTACNAAVETSPGLFSASCPNRAVGNYSVRGILNDSGQEVDRDTNNDVYVGADGQGDKYDAIGDSLTLGVEDNYQTDNLNLLDRKTISFQGWVGPLGDMLTTARGAPNQVGNEGISGDELFETRQQRLSSILQRNSIPRSNRALVTLGTNDSNTNGPTPSGAGCVGAACNGTYNGQMELLIADLQGAGRDIVYLSILPPAWGSTLNDVYADPSDLTGGAPRNATIREYNDVIFNELSLITDVELGPNLYSCFLSPTVNRFSMFEDSLHMNSLGYAFVAALWNDVLTGAPAIPLDGPCASPIYIAESLDPYVHGHKQNLIEEGDEVYVDASNTVQAIPTELEGGVWILQRSADNANTDASFLNFDAGSTAVTVYIAYDPAGSPPTSSTHTFAASSLSGPVTISGSNFSVVEATGVTGTVTIGGTHSGAVTGGQEAYTVIIVP